MTYINKIINKDIGVFDEFNKDEQAIFKELLEKSLKSVKEKNIDSNAFFNENSIIDDIKLNLYEEISNLTEKHLENGDLIKLAAYLGYSKIISKFIINHSSELIETIYNMSPSLPPVSSTSCSCSLITQYEPDGRVSVENIMKGIDLSKNTPSINTNSYIDKFNSFEEAQEVRDAILLNIEDENKKIKRDPYRYKLKPKKMRKS